MPKRRRNRLCSKQSSRDSLTVEATRNPATDQFCKVTSVVVRGCADVTAATTTSGGIDPENQDGTQLRGSAACKRNVRDPDFTG